MPDYVYEVIHDDGSAGERFEIEQRMSDPPLETHPETGQKVRRIYLPPHIAAGRWSDRAITKNMADNQKLERLGFTKYVKTAGGYEKVVGQGPKKIQKPGS
jgi:hypothetical protein